jgi:hypothetical protein
MANFSIFLDLELFPIWDSHLRSLRTERDFFINKSHPEMLTVAASSLEQLHAVDSLCIHEEKSEL